MKIITKYILKEILTPFGITLTVFTLIFILGNLMQLIELIVRKGCGNLRCLSPAGVYASFSDGLYYSHVIFHFDPDRVFAPGQ